MMSAYWFNFDDENNSNQEKKENKESKRKKVLAQGKEKCTISSDDIKNKLEAASKRREVCNIVFQYKKLSTVKSPYQFLSFSAMPHGIN